MTVFCIGVSDVALIVTIYCCCCGYYCCCYCYCLALMLKKMNKVYKKMLPSREQNICQFSIFNTH